MAGDADLTRGRRGARRPPAPFADVLADFFAVFAVVAFARLTSRRR
jgi:hypothetical protein